MPFQPINLFGDPMGSIGAPAPKNEVDDAFGELFGTKPEAVNPALPTQTAVYHANIDVKPTVDVTSVPVSADDDDGFGDFSDFTEVSTTQPKNKKTNN